jgi:hypothetical protein
MQGVACLAEALLASQEAVVVTEIYVIKKFARRTLLHG